ncbi:MAG: Disulfide-bond oxidoreductase YfcG [Candidatus Celerinatantimonas neptuna]|nr:MAG: Disulfide-bond oxidoreductase YfcG [Candidatus Celerinatantimonas neptuna]
MIQVHHLEQSRSTRILWLLEEMKLPYEVILYHREPTYEAPPSLKKIHPLGKSPVITDGELTIAESGAIIEYIVDTYDRDKHFRPKDGQARLDYQFWLHFAEGTLMPLLLMQLVLGKAESAPMPFFVRPIARRLVGKINELFILPRLKLQFEFIESTLHQKQWLAGNAFSSADIQMGTSLLFARQRCDLTLYPYLCQYLERLEQRPAYQKVKLEG